MYSVVQGQHDYVEIMSPGALFILCSVFFIPYSVQSKQVIHEMEREGAARSINMARLISANCHLVAANCQLPARRRLASCQLQPVGTSAAMTASGPTLVIYPCGGSPSHSRSSSNKQKAGTRVSEASKTPVCFGFDVGQMAMGRTRHGGQGAHRCSDMRLFVSLNA